MPSYIELDKQGSFPPSSDISKVIFGVDTSGNVTITNVSGTTTPIGGGGTGLYIPKPIVYSTQSGAQSNHGYNQNITSIGNGSGTPGAYQNSWDDELLKLTYDTYDETFLNYNPKYFLFIYKGNKKQSKPNISHPNNRLNGKFGKYFVHPPSYSGFVNTSTYKNFSGNLPNYSQFNPSFTSFISEWDVTSGAGKETKLNGFNPLRFYYTAGGTFSYLKGNEFFPIRVDSISGNNASYFIKVTTKKMSNSRYVEPKTTPIPTYLKPKLDLYIKFAIVINDPNNPGRYLIGPMSDTVKIFPKEGYFKENIITNNTYKYYYDWGWKFV